MLSVSTAVIMKKQLVLILCFALAQIRGATLPENENNEATNEIKDDSQPPVNNYDPKSDVESLKKALTGEQVDCASIIQILTGRTNAQRIDIAVEYKKSHKENLREEFEKKLEKDIANLLIALITPTTEYYAKELHNAMFGPNKDNNCLIEVLTTLRNEEMKKVCDSYSKLYGTTLEADIKENTSSHFQELLTTLTKGKREENEVVNKTEAMVDAMKLYRAGEKKWGTDESAFISVLSERSPEHLQETMREYERISEKGLMYAIKCEFSGILREALSSVLKVVSNVSGYYAERLHNNIEGRSINSNGITRIIAKQSDKRMGSINHEFSSKYGKSLQDAIAEDTSGDFKAGLLALIGKK